MHIIIIQLVDDVIVDRAYAFQSVFKKMYKIYYNVIMVCRHHRCCAFHQCGQNESRRNDSIVDRCEDNSVRFSLLNTTCLHIKYKNLEEKYLCGVIIAIRRSKTFHSDFFVNG